MKIQPKGISGQLKKKKKKKKTRRLTRGLYAHDVDKYMFTLKKRQKNII